MQTSWVPIYYYLFCFVFVFLKTWKTDSVVFFKNCGKLMECMKWDALTSLWSIKVMQICIYSCIFWCKTFILHIKLLWVIIVKSLGFHILGMWPLMISQMLLASKNLFTKRISRLIITFQSVPEMLHNNNMGNMVLKISSILFSKLQPLQDILPIAIFDNLT